MLLAVGCDGRMSYSEKGIEAVTVTDTVAAPTWQARMLAGDRHDYLGRRAPSVFESLFDPQAAERRWQQNLKIHGCRVIQLGTSVRVIGREQKYREIRLDADEDTWWVRKEDLRRGQQ